VVTKLRRRVAQRARQSSDVTRWRGLGVAAAAGVLTVVALLLAGQGTSGLRAPGPQSRPHRLAKLECAACHRDGAAAAKACPRCHGTLRSTRTAHQELRDAGRLRCVTCHAIHRADEGVALSPDGSATFYGTGWERAAPGFDSAFRPEKAVSVPLVPARICGECHDLSSLRDPIRACLVDGRAASVCFDEHRSVSSLAGVGAKVAPGATASRDAAWEAARLALLADARAPAAGRFGTPSSVLGLGLAVAFAVFGGAGAWAKRRRREKQGEAPPVEPTRRKRLPRVDVSTCLGCHACVDACPYDVLEVKRYVAVVARPEDCCGLTLCEQRCPNGSLTVEEGEPVDDRPKVSAELESLDVPGIYLAGDLTGLPLIRNAINQGATAVRHIAGRLAEERGPKDAFDLLIVGAGPAGISAALEAKSRGLRAKTLEQSSVASSIQSFPRGKLVFDQPLGMPLVGDLWLEESSKEELLGKWLRIVRRAELDIAEGERVTRVARRPDGAFDVEARREDGTKVSRSARAVLLCIGRRGSPRRLAIPVAEAAEDRVFYSLADARTFAGKDVLVVGLGDSAMEAAIALALQPDTRVTLVHRGNEFHRGKQRNIEEVKRLLGRGRLDLRFGTTLERVEADHVLLRTPSGDESARPDAIFVLIGAIVPWEFLAAAGIGATGVGASRDAGDEPR